MTSLIILLSLTSFVVSSPTEKYNLDSINDFSFRLLENVAADTEENFAISPLSVWNLFTSLAEGASGTTFTELITQLKLPNDVSTTRAMHSAVARLLNASYSDAVFKRKSSMFADRSLEIHEDFCRSASMYDTLFYIVESKNATQVANSINYYICLATYGKIRDLVTPEMLENIRLLLVDAMYFKANWTRPFDQSETRKGNFYDHHGRVIGTVNMMYQKAPHTINYDDDLKTEILELKYGTNDEFSMVILQPYEGITMKKFLKNLSMQPLKLWARIGEKSDYIPDLDCYLPRFKISSQIDLVTPMKYMGFYDIFDEVRAQLPGISDYPLFVSKTLQKVELEVTEEGTEAASGTVVGLEDRILAQRVEINRPFVFMIVENKINLIVFTGVYAVPNEF